MAAVTAAAALQNNGPSNTCKLAKLVIPSQEYLRACFTRLGLAACRREKEKDARAAGSGPCTEGSGDARPSRLAEAAADFSEAPVADAPVPAVEEAPVVADTEGPVPEDAPVVGDTEAPPVVASDVVAVVSLSSSIQSSTVVAGVVVVW